MVVRNAKGEPFSSWKPADKFRYQLLIRHPEIFRRCHEEYEFDHERKWRFDFCWPTEKVAVEIDGFGWGHQAQQMISANHEKQNAAVAQGWKVFRFTSRQLGSLYGVHEAVDLVCEFLCGVHS